MQWVAGASVGSALRLLQERGVHGAPVRPEDSDSVLGMVDVRDLATALLLELEKGVAFVLRGAESEPRLFSYGDVEKFRNVHDVFSALHGEHLRRRPKQEAESLLDDQHHRKKFSFVSWNQNASASRPRRDQYGQLVKLLHVVVRDAWLGDTGPDESSSCADLVDLSWEIRWTV